MDRVNLNIHQIQNKFLFCMESSIATVANFYGKNYELMFKNLWNFDFDNRVDKIVGNRVIIRPFEMERKLEEYHGIRIEHKFFLNNKDILRFAIDELKNGRPILIFFNCKYWPSAFESDKKQEFPFPYLVTGVDEFTNNMCMLDLHVYKKIETIPIEAFLNGCIPEAGCYAFYQVGDEYCSDHLISLIEGDISDIFASKNYDNSFFAIKAFARAISDELNNNEYTVQSEKKEKFTDFPLFNKLTDVCRSRELYGIFIDYVGKANRLNGFAGLAQALFRIASEWTMVRGLLLHALYVKDIANKRSRIADRIELLAEKEEHAALQLKDLCSSQHHNFCVNEKAHLERTRKDLIDYILPLNLSRYHNNKGFANSIEEKTYADFSGYGEYLLTNKLALEGTWVFGNKRFVFPQVGGSLCDNISCSGQSLEVPQDQYKYVMILGTSVLGNYSEFLSLRYIDDQTEQLMIEFADWQFGEMPSVAPDVAWVGLAEKRSNALIEQLVNRYIYAKMYPVKKGTLKSIILPDCPNLHLFAITLAC